MWEKCHFKWKRLDADQCNFILCTPSGKKNVSKRAESDIHNIEIHPECNRVLVDHTGELTSPNWPKKQVDYTACRIAIVLAHTWRPLLTFHQFELEGSDNHVCKEDELDNYVLVSSYLYIGVSMSKSRITQIVRHNIPFLTNYWIGPLKMQRTRQQNLPLSTELWFWWYN